MGELVDFGLLMQPKSYDETMGSYLNPVRELGAGAASVAGMLGKQRDNRFAADQKQKVQELWQDFNTPEDEASNAVLRGDVGTSDDGVMREGGLPAFSLVDPVEHFGGQEAADQYARAMTRFGGMDEENRFNRFAQLVAPVDRELSDKMMEIAENRRVTAVGNTKKLLDETQRAYDQISSAIQNSTIQAKTYADTGDSENAARLFEEGQRLEGQRAILMRKLQVIAPGVYGELDAGTDDGHKATNLDPNKYNELVGSDIYDTNGNIVYDKFAAKATALGITGSLSNKSSQLAQAYADAQKATEIKATAKQGERVEAERQREIVKGYREQAATIVQPFKERFAPWSALGQDIEIAKAKVDSFRDLVRTNPAAAFSAIRAVNQSIEKGVTRNEEFTAMGGGPILGRINEIKSLIESQNPNAETAALALKMLEDMQIGVSNVVSDASKRFANDANAQLSSSYIDPRNEKAGTFSKYKTVTPRDFYTAISTAKAPEKKSKFKRVTFGGKK